MRQICLIVYQCMRLRSFVATAFFIAHSRRSCSARRQLPSCARLGQARAPVSHTSRITAAEVRVSGYDSSSQSTNIEENAA